MATDVPKRADEQNEMRALHSASLTGDKVPARVLLTPWGSVDSTNGSFVVDEEAVQLTVQAFDEHGTDLPIDYEHQTLGGSYSSPTGQAPAAGHVPAARWVKRVFARGRCWLAGGHRMDRSGGRGASPSYSSSTLCWRGRSVAHSADRPQVEPLLYPARIPDGRGRSRDLAGVSTYARRAELHRSEVITIAYFAPAVAASHGKGLSPFPAVRPHSPTFLQPVEGIAPLYLAVSGVLCRPRRSGLLARSG